MKRILALCLFFLCSSAFATAQFPEVLLLDGKQRALYTNPLEPWLRQPGNGEKLKPYVSERRCSASWRGYEGSWEIKNGQLFLIGLRANPCSQQSPVIPLSALFPGQSAPVAATWFSGRLTVPDGKQIKYVHMGYGTQYERYILIEVDRGRVLGRQTVTELPGARREPKPFPAHDASTAPRITS